MPKDYQDITSSIAQYVGELKSACPEPMKGFSQLAKEAVADGVLSKKQKELIALCIGVTQHCDGCIGFHVKTLISLGATREEVSEALTMCVYMGGGPALMYAADALRAYDEFSN